MPRFKTHANEKVGEQQKKTLQEDKITAVNKTIKSNNADIVQDSVQSKKEILLTETFAQLKKQEFKKETPQQKKITDDTKKRWSDETNEKSKKVLRASFCLTILSAATIFFALALENLIFVFLTVGIILGIAAFIVAIIGFFVTKKDDPDRDKKRNLLGLSIILSLLVLTIHLLMVTYISSY